MEAAIDNTPVDDSETEPESEDEIETQALIVSQLILS